MQQLIHYGLHFIAPAAIAFAFYRDDWKRVYLIFLATMLVDLDHLFAYPDVFVADRCSIGFHPLHSIPAIALYIVLLLPHRTRLVALGLLFHMATDYIDCMMM